MADDTKQKSAWRQECSVYLDHVVALIWPGKTVRAHPTGSSPASVVGDLDGWQDADLDLLIEEGRRTFESQAKRFDRVRSTAQVILPTATALLVILGSELNAVTAESTDWVRYLEYGAWVIGTVLVLLGVLGSASVLTVRSPFGMLLPTLISQQDPPIKKELARGYARQTMVGEETVATRLTVTRDAVTLVAIGGTLHLILWFVRVL